MTTGVLTAAELRNRRGAENFPVAIRLLPAGLRRDLRAVYDVARTIDELGDGPGFRTPAERLVALDEFGADLLRIWSAPEAVRHPVLVRLTATVQVHRLPAEPFCALIEANRIDQRRDHYPTWADLRHYCSLSADPVGRIVLGIFDAATPQRIAWSDDVCTALQVLEHCQDVAEDRRRGRTYLPLQTLAEHGAEAADLDRPVTSPAVRAAVAAETARAEGLLRHSGPALLATLRGVSRFAIAGFVAGGLATADALRRAEFDVLATVPRPGKPATVRHALRLLGGHA
jgi:squalene synthase HpnC